MILRWCCRRLLSVFFSVRGHELRVSDCDFEVVSFIGFVGKRSVR